MPKSRTRNNSGEQAPVESQIAQQPIDEATETINALVEYVPAPDSVVRIEENPTPLEQANVIAAEIPPLDIEIDPSLPWAGLVSPTVHVQDVNTVRAEVVILEPTTEGEPFKTGVGFRVADDVLIRDMTPHAIKEIGWQVAAPTDFVTKLSPETQVSVWNERFADSKSRSLAFVSEGDTLKNVTTEWREVAPHKIVAHTAYEQLGEIIEANPTVAEFNASDSFMWLRLMTQEFSPQITPAEGDILRMGVEVNHAYGREVRVALYTERLVCLNGMTSGTSNFEWKRKSEGTVESQVEWIRIAVSNAFAQKEQLVEHCQQMAETEFDGHPHDALRQRAQLLRIPRGRWNAVIAAYDEEPGNTEWHLLNALTRFATHNPELTSRDRARIQMLSGEWAADFNTVTARLPRQVALKVGAHILAEEPDEVVSA